MICSICVRSSVTDAVADMPDVPAAPAGGVVLGGVLGVVLLGGLPLGVPGVLVVAMPEPAERPLRIASIASI